jgi:DNA-binding FadR family transcriptional regulator
MEWFMEANAIDTPNAVDPAGLLRRMIKEGRFGAHDRLPPERILSAELGVTRNTLRKALAVLESEGMIWRHVGRGTFVGSHPKPTKIDFSQLVEITSPAEIMEVRLLIEPKTAAMSAMRATRQEIKKMQNAVHRSETAASFEDNEKWDLILHEIIARTANNHLLLTFVETLNGLRKGEHWGRMKAASLTAERWKHYAQQHHALVAAIRHRNASLAEELMREHLKAVHRNLLMGS